MKILLFLSDKIVTYNLPALVSGSYSFDISKDEESKLINIEARNNAWVIYSTDDSFVVYDNKKIEYLDFSDKEELIFKAPEKDCPQRQSRRGRCRGRETEAWDQLLMGFRSF